MSDEQTELSKQIAIAEKIRDPEQQREQLMARQYFQALQMRGLKVAKAYTQSRFNKLVCRET